MHLATFSFQGQQTYGFLSDSKTEMIDVREAERRLFSDLLLPSTLAEVIGNAQFVGRMQEIRRNITEASKAQFFIPLPEIVLEAPIPEPKRNIICLGLNYRAHALEFGKTEDEWRAIPQHPIIFTKATTTVIGPEQPINPHPHVTTELDYEAELAVVIGKEGTRISKEEAYDYIFGYTIINDVTARDLQRDHDQWFLGKSLDTFCPMGPYLVTSDEVSKPDMLDVQCKVNGEIRQKSNTELLIFDIPTIINTISKGITLKPGDIIATGTPKGVGMGFEPPRYLKSGDLIEIEIEKLGVLKNTVA